jgi:hypothetical protein
MKSHQRYFETGSGTTKQRYSGYCQSEVADHQIIKKQPIVLGSAYCASLTQVGSNQFCRFWDDSRTFRNSIFSVASRRYSHEGFWYIPRRRIAAKSVGGNFVCRLEQPTGAAAEATEAIEKAGGCVVGSYKEPLAGHPVLLCVLPIDAVEPTPFQRDLSDAHHKRLADVINKTGRFLDPIIAVVAPKGGFWTPNGRHRLAAMRRLGAKSITALVVADREVAWQILALNTEKAHNLKERSLEVIRIYRGLVEEDATRAESQFAFYLDEPALVTLGVCYERFPRFGGGAYHSILRRLGPLPMNRSALPSRITRNGPRLCSTSRRKLRPRCRS